MIRRLVIYGVTILLLLSLLFLALSHLPLFTISQVQVKIDGPLKHVPSEISNRLSTLVGQGIFRVSLRGTKKQIENADRLSWSLQGLFHRRSSGDHFIIHRIHSARTENVPIWSMGAPLSRLTAVSGCVDGSFVMHRGSSVRPADGTVWGGFRLDSVWLF